MTELLGFVIGLVIIWTLFVLALRASIKSGFRRFK